MDATEMNTNRLAPAALAASMTRTLLAPFPAYVASSSVPMVPTHDTTASTPLNASANAFGYGARQCDDNSVELSLNIHITSESVKTKCVCCTVSFKTMFSSKE